MQGTRGPRPGDSDERCGDRPKPGVVEPSMLFASSARDVIDWCRRLAAHTEVPGFDEHLKELLAASPNSSSVSEELIEDTVKDLRW